MAEKPSVFFKATHSLMFGGEASRIRRRYGHDGMDRYVSLLCLLIDENDGTLDVSDDDGWRVLSDLLWFDGDDECREFVAYLAGRGIIDEKSLGDGVLKSRIVDDGIDSWLRARRGGRKPSS